MLTCLRFGSPSARRCGWLDLTSLVSLSLNYRSIQFMLLSYGHHEVKPGDMPWVHPGVELSACALRSPQHRRGVPLKCRQRLAVLFGTLQLRKVCLSARWLHLHSLPSSSLFASEPAYSISVCVCVCLAPFYCLVGLGTGLFACNTSVAELPRFANAQDKFHIVSSRLSDRLYRAQ